MPQQNDQINSSDKFTAFNIFMFSFIAFLAIQFSAQNPAEGEIDATKAARPIFAHHTDFVISKVKLYQIRTSMKI